MRLVLVLPFLIGLSVSAQIGRGGAPAQVPQTGWVFGLQKLQPTLSVRAEGVRDGKATLVDSEADLGLGRRGSSTGFLAEYQGQEHAFQVSYGTAAFEGGRVLSRDVLLDGTRFAAGTDLRSSADVEVVEGLWTYKFARSDDSWLGFDLGAQYFKGDLEARGGAQIRQARPAMVLPQIGLTGWSSGAGGLLESRAFIRYFTRRGASVTRYGLDARAYLYPGFGLRMIFEDSRIRIPRGSLEQDLDLRVDTRFTGLGLVVRF